VSALEHNNSLQPTLAGTVTGSEAYGAAESLPEHQRLQQINIRANIINRTTPAVVAEGWKEHQLGEYRRGAPREF
jgi:hypothetical protein